MPMIPNTLSTAGCPYCYSGTLAFDKYSGWIYCKRCNYAVLIEGLCEDPKEEQKKFIRKVNKQFIK